MVSSVDSERLTPEAAPARERTGPSADGREPGDRRRMLALPALTLLIGLLVTLALAIVSQSQYRSNENRLLRLRVRDASTLLTGSLPATQTTLGSAAELADVTNGNARRFRSYVAADITGPKKMFASVSLWRVDHPTAGPVTVVGPAPKLASTPARAVPLFAEAQRLHTLGVVALLNPPTPSLGYVFVSGRYAVYAETPLPADRRSRLASNSAFAGLDYAVYLGRREDPSQLLVTNVTHLPLPGYTSAQTIPFGDTDLTIAMSSRVSLPGTLPRDLPWIIAILGVLLSVAAALMTWRLTQRRQAAERLAGENRRLADQQRTIAQTLQHALLPDTLPSSPGLEASGRFAAGEAGLDVGGDWYDVIELGDRRVLLVVGDVSGRGLHAATTMASLRFAIRAYAAQGDDPPAILTKLSHLVSVVETGQLATILCALVDTERGVISISSAGHLPPLLIDADGGRFVDPELGVPIGVEAGAEYAAREESLPADGTLVGFTDGLVELRGESIDEGLERLRSAATRNGDDLQDLLARLVVEVPEGRSDDDIAIVGVRWKR